MPEIFEVPVLQTDSQNVAHSLAAYKAAGWGGVQYQAQNDSQLKDFDLAPARAAGLSPGVWGVTYNAANFFRDGQLLARQAVKLGADHVTMDAEECAKNTRATRALKPIIDGVRAGGWNGPVHLTTLGAPSNPTVNDYAMDTASFTETGGGIFAQAYANDSTDYLPGNCVDYWTRIVGRERINLTIAWYEGRLGKINGSGWLELLKPAVGQFPRQISAFQPQGGEWSDYEALKPLTLPTPPPPPPPAGDYAELERLVNIFRSGSPNIAKAFDQVEALLKKHDAQIAQARQAGNDAGLDVDQLAERLDGILARVRGALG